MTSTSTSTELRDPLLYLRQAIATNKLPLLTTSADATSASEVETELSRATHLQFNNDEGHYSFPLTTPTRFLSSDKPVDLRSIYFAWQKKDVAFPDYVASTQKLSEELAASDGAGGTVQNLVFIEKLELVTWLEGVADESEHIAPLPAEAAAQAARAGAAADIAAGAAGGIAAVHSASQAAPATKTVDPRLAEIYNGERRVGDRNSVLRGIKPTDFSHVRKHAEAFLGRARQRPGTSAAASGPMLSSSPALVSNLKKPGRRLEPIILLSPSASSLLRMSNVKSFLDNGLYVPPDNSIAGSSTAANIMNVSRVLPSIDSRPLRFFLVDTPDQFKPDYWARVVAVFTTGQTWQFKSYKWTQPAELFAHALGIYVGWRGEDTPATVKGWGRGVLNVVVDKWNAHQGTAGRWRDREVVESIWTAIEESMRNKGWGKHGVSAPR